MRGIQFSRHVGQHPLNRLILRDRATKRVSAFGVSQGLVECCLANTERLSADRNPATVECPHRDTKPLTRLAEHRLGVDRHIIEFEVHTAEPTHTQRSVDCGPRQPGGVDWHEKGAHPATTDTQLGRRKKYHQIGSRGVGDPYLSTMQPITRTLPCRRRQLVCRVRARVWL